MLFQNNHYLEENLLQNELGKVPSSSTEKQIQIVPTSSALA
jgi:hypothetical protein